jgi:hypothetical protein
MSKGDIHVVSSLAVTSLILAAHGWLKHHWKRQAWPHPNQGRKLDFGTTLFEVTTASSRKQQKRTASSLQAHHSNNPTRVSCRCGVTNVAAGCYFEKSEFLC